MEYKIQKLDGHSQFRIVFEDGIYSHSDGNTVIFGSKSAAEAIAEHILNPPIEKEKDWKDCK